MGRKKLHFQLNGWPPLASHGCMLFIGIFAATLQNKSSARETPLQEIKPGWTLLRPARSIRNLKSGDSMILIDKRQRPSCRMPDLTANAVSMGDKVYLLLDARISTKWQPFHQRDRFQWVHEKELSQHKPCSQKATIRYRSN